MYTKSLILFALVCCLVNALPSKNVVPVPAAVEAPAAPAVKAAPAIPAEKATVLKDKKILAPVRSSRKSVSSALVKKETQVEAKGANGRYQYIYESNMDYRMQADLLLFLGDSFYLSDDIVDITHYMQNYMDLYYPDYYWNVVANYEAASFYNYYYAVAVHNSHTFLIIARILKEIRQI